jgi:Ser/Thr protein kinase RdoA (MazF antagonist)
MNNYVTDSLSYDEIGIDSIAFEAGRAFGLFQYLTADMDPSGLFEVLPGFHDAQLRLSNFRKSVERDVAGRRSSVNGDIRFAEARAEKMQQIKQLGEAGKIPLRVTHNDTKCNNVLFSPEDKAIAIVDLDTIMPGYSLYDFGDAIRTGTNTAAEDEQNLDKVGINLDLFEAYTGGYLSVALPSLNQVELEHLAFSARYMTWLIGLRFLTDYLDGDVYYKTSFPEHNLHRARVQFKLLESMEMNAQKMEAIIDNQQTKDQSAHETR